MTQGVLDLEAFRATPLTREPFEFLTVRRFVRLEARAAIDRDFPPVTRGGSYPVQTLTCGPAFTALVEALNGPEMRAAFEDKFGLSLAGRPTITTVRGRSTDRDGNIHTDSATKIITVLIYLNADWGDVGGRLRLLRSRDSLENPLAEIPPEWGALVAFRRSANSWHGHAPFIGERRALQFNWVTDESVVRRELGRHRLSAGLKRFMPIPSLR